ncbi:hypothetical protein [Aneurinibacillus uraniidurans]|uniref:hypothetical protein n=1 Tax=Aneurinibacillus uraniidurans TaxID=2966586 RepID=UPI00234AEF90|nr:hypothetical protein [Aneurinibacillus sp. B1]WCN36509.1 hypothetical protein PO771_11520 [Aneurinibacillus sp. B1]
MKYLLRVDERGRILLPEEVRKKLGYGTVSIEAEDDVIMIKKEAPVASFNSILNK